MRSLGVTFILALLAAVAVTAAGWLIVGKNFEELLGAPPAKVGDRIYKDFKPSDVKSMRITTNGVTATFQLGENGWQALTPWKDRMDPRAAVGIIDFTLGLTVEDFAGIGEIDPQKAGLKESGVDIRLEGAGRQQIARYKLGRQTPWLATVKDEKKPVPTVFIQPRDENHKRFIYACTGDIGPVFKDSLKFLRDHHPFYFNPAGLQKIRILNSEGEPILSRDSPNHPWRIIKPLPLATDPSAMKSLREGLFELRAVKVYDRSAVTLPAAATGPAGKPTQIALTSFGSTTETLLEIYPPESPDSPTVKAVVSDRPDTVFDLLLKSEPGLVSLADLPLTVNALRDASLTNLNIKDLASVLIQPATGKEILISRKPPQPWMATIDGLPREANEERLFALLKAVTDGRVIEFKTDAATDFTPWGLDKPVLKLRFTATDNQSLELAFGVDAKGNAFVNRVGTPTVMRIDPSLLSSLPMRASEWRQARVWSIDRTALKAIARKSSALPPLTLLYNDKDESWIANSEGKDVTSLLDPNRAKYLLGILEGLKVTRWLSPDDESAESALLRPTLAFQVTEDTTDDMLEVTGTMTRVLILAPASPGPNPAFYYGRLANEDQPFMLDKDTYGKLATEVLEKE